MSHANAFGTGKRGSRKLSTRTSRLKRQRREEKERFLNGKPGNVQKERVPIPSFSFTPIGLDDGHDNDGCAGGNYSTEKGDKTALSNAKEPASHQPVVQKSSFGLSSHLTPYISSASESIPSETLLPSESEIRNDKPQDEDERILKVKTSLHTSPGQSNASSDACDSHLILSRAQEASPPRQRKSEQFNLLQSREGQPSSPPEEVLDSKLSNSPEKSLADCQKNDNNTEMHEQKSIATNCNQQPRASTLSTRTAREISLAAEENSKNIKNVSAGRSNFKGLKNGKIDSSNSAFSSSLKLPFQTITRTEQLPVGGMKEQVEGGEENIKRIIGCGDHAFGQERDSVDFNSKLSSTSNQRENKNQANTQKSIATHLKSDYSNPSSFEQCNQSLGLTKCGADKLFGAKRKLRRKPMDESTANANTCDKIISSMDHSGKENSLNGHDTSITSKTEVFPEPSSLNHIHSTNCNSKKRNMETGGKGSSVLCTIIEEPHSNEKSHPTDTSESVELRGGEKRSASSKEKPHHRPSEAQKRLPACIESLLVPLCLSEASRVDPAHSQIKGEDHPFILSNSKLVNIVEIKIDDKSANSQSFKQLIEVIETKAPKSEALGSVMMKTGDVIEILDEEEEPESAFNASICSSKTSNVRNSAKASKGKGKHKVHHGIPPFTSGSDDDFDFEAAIEKREIEQKSSKRQKNSNTKAIKKGTTHMRTSAQKQPRNNTPSKKLCSACASCKCHKRDATSATPQKMLSISSLSGSDARVEQSLIDRLKRIERNVAWVEESRQNTARELMKHRAAMMKKWEDKSPITGVEGSRFLADVQVSEALPRKKLEPKEVDRAKGIVFGTNKKELQTTLTQLCSFDKNENGTANQVTIGEGGGVKINDGSAENATCSENGQDTPQNESHFNRYLLNNAYNDVLSCWNDDSVLSVNNQRISSMSDFNMAISRFKEKQKASLASMCSVGVWAKATERSMKSEFSSSCDDVEHTHHNSQSDLGCFDAHCSNCFEDGSLRDEEEGFDALLHLFDTSMHEESDEVSHATTHNPNDHERSSPIIDPSHCLTPRGKSLINEIEASVLNDAPKKSAIERACPDWKSNILYPQLMTDAVDIRSALQRVKQAKQKFGRMKEKVVRSLNDREQTLDLFEVALQVSLNRFIDDDVQIHIS